MFGERAGVWIRMQAPITFGTQNARSNTDPPKDKLVAHVLVLLK
jgi:hypothetical protein